MGTAIEWTDETWNPVTGCDKVSPGCDHCYAETIAHRFAGAKAFPDGFAVTLHPERLDQPKRWRKPRKVFVNSMSDLFHDAIPERFILGVFGVMAECPQHTFQILTKRHARMRSLLTRWSSEVPWMSDPLPNVWLGVSVEDQKWADIRIPALLETPAAVRFISAEPLLNMISIADYLDRGGRTVDMGAAGVMREPDCPIVDWVIVGGESGLGARPMYPDWARNLRDECQIAGVAFLFKQWGGRTPKANGRLLDGRTWDEYPERAA